MKAVGLVTKKIREMCLVKIPGVREVLVRGNWRLGEKVELDVDLLRRKEEMIVLRVKGVRRGEGELGVEIVRKGKDEKKGKREVLTGTLCSQSKRKVAKATPGVLWDSSRIQKYLEFCDQYELPASIVSWKYGIVPREEEVFNYDEFETRKVEHWVKVMREARDRYGVKELYVWFDPSRTISGTILRAARKVFEKSGGTKHLYNLNRYLSGRRDLEDVVSSWVPARSRVIVINSGDFSPLYHLTNEKYCKCIVYDSRPWAKEVQKAVVKRERIPRRLPEELPELLKHDNLTVRAAAILYSLQHKGVGSVDLSELREIGEILLKIGRYRRVEVRNVFPKIPKNDIVLIKEPTSHSFLERYFGEAEEEFDWDEVMFKLGKRLPSSVIIIREGKLREVNSFYRKTGKYFSDRSVLTFNDDVVYRCA